VVYIVLDSASDINQPKPSLKILLSTKTSHFFRTKNPYVYIFTKKHFVMQKKRDEKKIEKESKYAEFFEKVEHYNEKLIPYALVLLFFIIIFELFLHVEDPTTLTIVHTLDYIIISIFVIDLIFIARKVHNMRIFFKHYWLDLLAVFPFAFFFSTIDRLYLLFRAEQVAVSQAVLHETVEVGKAASKIERLGKFSKFTRGIRIIARIVRLGIKGKAMIKRYTHRKKQNSKSKT